MGYCVWADTMNRRRDKDRSREADTVTGRIATILSENAFTFAVPQYVGIHKRLFMGVFSHAGKIRDYNISKHEWVLDGVSVHYGNALDLRELLEYDMRMEKEYEYSLEGIPEMIPHLAKFVSRLWQIHAFGDGGVIIGTSQLRQAKSRLALICPNFLSQMGHEVGRRRKISYLRTEVGWECAAA